MVNRAPVRTNNSVFIADEHCRDSCYLLENSLVPPLPNKINTCSQCHPIYLSSCLLAFALGIYPSYFLFPSSSLPMDTLPTEYLLPHLRWEQTPKEYTIMALIFSST